MDLGETKEWILVVTSALTMLSIAAGVVSFSVATIFALLEYRLKLKAEKRVAISQEAETDVRLIHAFTELMNIANGRGGYVVSEKAMEEVFKRGGFEDRDFNDLVALKRRIGEFPIINLPVGLASQDAAIAAVATIGLKYPVLKEPARVALESAKLFRRDVAEFHLNRLLGSE